MNKLSRFSAPLALLMLGACATIPTGPSVMVMPGTGKSFEQFRADDAECKQFALEQVGGATANQTAIDSGVKSAALGAAVGALAGAAIGSHYGAGVGAGTGLLVGSIAGTGAGEASAYGSQRRYDNSLHSVHVREGRTRSRLGVACAGANSDAQATAERHSASASTARVSPAPARVFSASGGVALSTQLRRD